jgi:hypothetical protein
MAASARARRLRSLNTPAPIAVQADVHGAPAAVAFSGRPLAVEERLETWRIDDEWWRERPISRVYWRLLLEDGRTVDVYRDGVSGQWFRQAYG